MGSAVWLRGLLAAVVLGGLMAVTPPAAAQGRVSFARAVQVAGPSVVNIFAAKVSAVEGDASAFTRRVARSLGSGVIVSPDGKLVTTLHVIEGASAVKVVTHDGREYGVRMLASDAKLDLAVLQLELPKGTTLPVAKFADSDQLAVGDLVLAVGNPYGMGQSISLGVVSAVARSQVALNPYAQFIQTDAAINPGNSGGALIDSTGAVVGLNTAVFSKEGEAQGLGFAIPANVVRTVVNDLITRGFVERPWLGAEGQGLTAALVQSLRLPDDNGVAITAVMPGSPAAEGGLKRGDVVRTLNGVPVTDAASLNESILTLPGLLNKPVTLGIWRDGKAGNLTLTLRALPQRRTTEQGRVKGYNPLAEVLLEPLGPALATEIGVPLNTKGVVVMALPGRALAAFDQRFKVGDVIQLINGQPATTVREAQGALETSRRAWEIQLLRDGKTLKIKF